MNCKYCGGRITLETKECPSCGIETPFAKQHAKDMERFEEEFRETKEYVKSKTGNRIGLDEVEKRLRACGIDAVCGGKDDLLAVALTSGDPNKVVQIISEEFKIHYSMVKAIVVPEIPRNESGKIQYTKLFEGIL